MNAPPHAGIPNNLAVADQMEIACAGKHLRTRRWRFSRPYGMLTSQARDLVTDFDSALAQTLPGGSAARIQHELKTAIKRLNYYGHAVDICRSLFTTNLDQCVNH